MEDHRRARFGGHGLVRGLDVLAPRNRHQADLDTQLFRDVLQLCGQRLDRFHSGRNRRVPGTGAQQHDSLCADRFLEQRYPFP
jgi:hypothetical protein